MNKSTKELISFISANIKDCYREKKRMDLYSSIAERSNAAAANVALFEFDKMFPADDIEKIVIKSLPPVKKTK